MKGRVVIITIGGHEIGMGHVMRCLSLAKALKRDKIDVRFFLKKGYDSDECVSSVSEKIRTEGFDVSLEDNVSKIFNEGNPDVLFIDFPHHVRRSEYVDNAKKRGIGSVVFDDMLLNGEAADIVINPSLVITKEPTVNSQSFYTGGDYTVINSSFCNAASHIKDIRNNVKNILITMGGSDPTRQTEKILDALMENRVDADIDVVIGMAYKGKLPVTSQQSPVKIHHNASNMAELMREADMAFIAGGITLYEAASIGLPVIVIAQDRYQEAAAKEFQKKGFGRYLGFFSDVTKDMIYEGFKELFNDYDSRKSMSDIGRKIVDGKGVFRVAEIIKLA
jgi:spore coat polysaccharide biosynthesis predicted glycosyltransferase SpsG